MEYRVPVIYNEGDTVFHRRDPRAKLVTFVLLMALLYVAPTWEWILALGILGGVMVMVARVPWRFISVLLALQFLQALSFLAFPAVMRMLSGRGAFAGTFDTALKFSLSWPAALFISASLFTTMELTELTDGLRGLGVPEIAVFTIEYVFLLFYVTISDLYRVADAMKLKGLHIETPNPVTLARNLPALGIPMFVSVLDRATTMMAVLEMRGYDFRERRALRTDLKFDAGDALFVLFGATVLGVTAAVRLGWLAVPVLPAGGA